MSVRHLLSRYYNLLGSLSKSRLLVIKCYYSAEIGLIRKGVLICGMKYANAFIFFIGFFIIGKSFLFSETLRLFYSLYEFYIFY